MDSEKVVAASSPGDSKSPAKGRPGSHEARLRASRLPKAIKKRTDKAASYIGVGGPKKTERKLKEKVIEGPKVSGWYIGMALFLLVGGLIVSTLQQTTTGVAQLKAARNQGQ